MWYVAQLYKKDFMLNPHMVVSLWVTKKLEMFSYLRRDSDIQCKYYIRAYIHREAEFYSYFSELQYVFLKIQKKQILHKPHIHSTNIPLPNATYYCKIVRHMHGSLSLCMIHTIPREKKPYKFLFICIIL